MTKMDENVNRIKPTHLLLKNNSLALKAPFVRVPLLQKK